MTEWLSDLRELRFDGGHTATAASAFAVERAIRWTNGSGDDIVDAVAEALGLRDRIDEEDADCFGDPLEILLREEEEE